MFGGGLVSCSALPFSTGRLPCLQSWNPQKRVLRFLELHLFWTLKGYSIPNLVELFEAAIPHA